jgi:hypothetical protein
MIIIPHRRMITPSGPTIIPGSVSYTSPGTYNFTVPYFHSLLADVRGASGGGGGYSEDSSVYNGSAGGYSYFNAPTGNLVGYGGQGGGGGNSYAGNGADGAHGSGVNGDYNGYGDATAGGAHAYMTSYPSLFGGNGGNGARAYRTWTKAQNILIPKSVITVVVGARGEAAPWNGDPYITSAQPGVAGAVYISWS